MMEERATLESPWGVGLDGQTLRVQNGLRTGSPSGKRGHKVGERTLACCIPLERPWDQPLRDRPRTWRRRCGVLKVTLRRAL